jgi:hypothetical protein
MFCLRTPLLANLLKSRMGWITERQITTQDFHLYHAHQQKSLTFTHSTNRLNTIRMPFIIPTCKCQNKISLHQSTHENCFKTQKTMSSIFLGLVLEFDSFRVHISKINFCVIFQSENTSWPRKT